MKMIISPAKKMNMDTDTFQPTALPEFLNETESLAKWIRALSYEEAKELWNCNDKIAGLNYERFQKMNLYKALTPALVSYEGIQYQYMAPKVFTRKEWDYVQRHLRILSGFYGVLRPLDGVAPYRLEMQAKACVGRAKSLYEFWGDKLYKAIRGEEGIILNLASKEYSKCIEKYLQPEDIYVTCVFGERKNGSPAHYLKVVSEQFLKVEDSDACGNKRRKVRRRKWGYVTDKRRGFRTFGRSGKV